MALFGHGNGRKVADLASERRQIWNTLKPGEPHFLDPGNNFPCFFRDPEIPEFRKRGSPGLNLSGKCAHTGIFRFSGTGIFRFRPDQAALDGDLRERASRSTRVDARRRASTSYTFSESLSNAA